MINNIKEDEKKVLSTITLASYLISGGVISPIIRDMKNFTDLILTPKPKSDITLEYKNFPSHRDYNVIGTIEVGGETINIVTDTTRSVDSSLILSDTTTVQSFDDYSEDYLSLNFETLEEMIAFYCKVFQLKEDVITTKINELINNDHYSWEYGHMLNRKSYESIEQAISRTIADISLRPEEFSLEEDEIRLEEYELEEYLPEELIYKFSDVIGVNPNIALAIAYAESGTSLDSYNFVTNHNVAGLHRRDNDPTPVTNGGYVIYRNEAEGLFRFILVLHDNFYVTEESDRNKINSMASTYCSLPDHWRNLVGGLYNDLETNGYDYIYNTFNYQDRQLIYPTSNSKTKVKR